MNGLQRFAMTILPRRWAEAMRAESESWMLVCTSCGHERSVWDAGGIRWKARSVGKRMAQRCPGCGKNGWARLEKR